MALPSDSRILKAVLAHTQSKYGLAVRKKSESRFMRLCAFFLKPFNPGFMSDYWTTIAGRCYYPGDEIRPADWRTLAHEGKHAQQSQAIGEPWFSAAYMFPQLTLLPVSLVGSVWSFCALPLPWWLALPIALVVFALPLLPWPAPWRTKYEAEAYTVSAVVDAMRGLNIDSESYKDYMDSHFAKSYYWPTWGAESRRKVTESIISTAKKALAGDTTVDPYLVEIIGVIQNA